MKLAITKTQKQKLHDLGKIYDLRFIILHGSYATGTATIDSDLDIAILEKNTRNTKTISFFISRTK